MEVSGYLVGSLAFKASATSDPRWAGSIPVHLRQITTSETAAQPDSNIRGLHHRRPRRSEGGTSTNAGGRRPIVFYTVVRRANSAASCVRPTQSSLRYTWARCVSTVRRDT